MTTTQTYPTLTRCDGSKYSAQQSERMGYSHYKSGCYLLPKGCVLDSYCAGWDRARLEARGE